MTTNTPDWAELRSLFPALARCTYLDTASSGPVSTPAMQAGQRFYSLSNAHGNLAAEDWYAEVAECRRSIAGFIGATTDEIGFVPNTSMAMACAALMFEGHGSVLTAEGEHPTVTTPWFARGYTVRRARRAPGGTKLEAFAEAITPNTRVIAVSHVRFDDGELADLAGLGALAKAHGAHLVVDAIQSAGIVPIDVDACGIDVLGFAGFKWLNAGYGGGGIYVRDGLLARYGLPIAGNRSRSTEALDEVTALDPLLKAQAFELGTMPVPNLMALNASLRLIAEIGSEAIAERVAMLTARLRAGLDRIGLTAAGPWASSIVAVQVSSPEAVQVALQAANVRVSLRGGRIRVAVSWYNNEADIDRCLDVLDATKCS